MTSVRGISPRQCGHLIESVMAARFASVGFRRGRNGTARAGRCRAPLAVRRAQQPRAGRIAFADAIQALELVLVIGPPGAVFAWTSATNCASALQAFDRFVCAAWFRSFVSLSRSRLWVEP